MRRIALLLPLLMVLPLTARDDPKDLKDLPLPVVGTETPEPPSALPAKFRNGGVVPVKWLECDRPSMIDLPKLAPMKTVPDVLKIYSVGSFPDVGAFLKAALFPHDPDVKVEYFPTVGSVAVCAPEDCHTLLNELLGRVANEAALPRKRLLILHAGYGKAANANQEAEAKRLASQILEIDPTYFAKAERMEAAQILLPVQPAGLQLPEEVLKPIMSVPSKRSDTQDPEFNLLKGEFEKMWKLNESLLKEDEKLPKKPNF